MPPPLLYASRPQPPVVDVHLHTSCAFVPARIEAGAVSSWLLPVTGVGPRFSFAVLGIVVDTPGMYSTAVVAAAVDAEAGRPVVDVVRIVAVAVHESGRSVVVAAAAEALRPAVVVVCTLYSADLRDCTVSSHYLLAGSETYAAFEPLPRKARHLMVVVVVAEDRTDGPHLLVVAVGVAGAVSDLNVLEAVVDVTPVPVD